ncbi:efflux RND transporter periplasmic adaptor subunit [Agarilytica rhodophyticola]|uniref:efflux RND transporter periplasmic adaptor subunit n=1 Tax=Agarilytica rhodophyticola TaxID=1737490 RepID=UPI000B34837B|nr:efflux RND transporter periplasmic adaptor subunit [Agarilytica rhodophyticola]
MIVKMINAIKQYIQPKVPALNIALSIGTAAFMVSNISFAQPSSSPAVVEIALAKTTQVSPQVWVPGSVISREDSNIASEVTGVLHFVAEVGDILKKGDTVARVNEHQLQLQLRRDKAELARLESRLGFAQKQLDRTLSLAQTSSTAEFRIDELTSQRDVLQQEIALAKVQQEQTQYLLDRSNIIAPFDGVVVERFQQPGEYVGLGEELVRLVNTRALEISARAPVDVSRFITPNSKIKIKAQDKYFNSTIRSVIPVGDPISRMLEVRVHLDGEWVIGDAVSLSLNNGPSVSAVTIPRDALVLRNDTVFVYRVNEKDVAEKISVVLGTGNDQNISVSGALKAGDRVVIRGAERLQDGREVNVMSDIATR